MNSIGTILRLTTFGESHGPAIGGVLDGVPAGYEIDAALVQQALDRRRPGGDALGSRRREADKVQLLSGIFESKTLGTPIGFVIPNTDAHSADYEVLKDLFRPCHADYTYHAKYGIRDWRGGGRASARETACRVAAGAIAAQILEQIGIRIFAYTHTIGDIVGEWTEQSCKSEDIYGSAVRQPCHEVAARMEALIERVRAEGDTIGGVVECVIDGVPAGVGSPVYGKLQAGLAAAMMSIPAAKGFEYGLGFKAAAARGSEAIDLFEPHTQPLRTATNHSGGIQGGISNGEQIRCKVAFKPVATLMQPVQTVDTDGYPVTLQMKGRHDACVVPRAVPVVEAMAALTVLDALLMRQTDKISL